MAPAALAADGDDLTATATGALATFQLEKKTGDVWASDGAATGFKAEHVFENLTGATEYRVVVARPGCVGGTTPAITTDGAAHSFTPVALVCDFSPTTPTRVLETRANAGEGVNAIVHINPASTIPADNNGKPVEGQITKVKVKDITSPVVPDDAVAVALNVTGVDSTTSDNFITVWDCVDAVAADDDFEPDPPLASNLNLSTNDIRPNAVIAEAGADDLICIYNRRPAHLIVDVTGFFSPQPTPQIQLDAPTRVLETRFSVGQVNYQGGKPGAGHVIRVDVGNDAEGQILNVTGVDGNGGWITAWDCDDKKLDDIDLPNQPDPPATSNLNVDAGVISANLVVTGSDASGFVCFYASQSVHIIADLIGTLPEPGRYVQSAPKRVLETREGIAASPQVAYSGPKPVPGRVIVLDLDGVDGDADNATSPVPEDTRAVILNVTGTGATANGFVTAYPCEDQNSPRPNASNLNLVTSQTRPNLVMIGLNSNGRVCLYTQSGTHLVADLVGSFPKF